MRKRREHTRFDTSLSLEIFTGKELLLAVSSNLSSGGVGVSMDSALPNGLSVEMSLFLVEEGIEDERTPPLYLKGKVVWCKGGGEVRYTAGIRFLSNTPEQSKRLNHFLSRLNS